MPLSLYLHFPLCRHTCAYCDYYKLPLDKNLADRFFEALQIETELAAESLPQPRAELETIYLGGGTPSLIEPELLTAWLEQVKRLFRISASLEFSIEINPESCRRELFEFWRQLGVTRPVLGVQSFDKRMLKRLTRTHTVSQVHEAVYYINTYGFDSFGCDLLFGLPGQTHKMLSTDLDQLVDLDPPHVSFYQLTAVPGTELYCLIEKGRLRLPGQDSASAMYQAGYEHFNESGLERYEVCSFARAGHECRHNLNYWSGGEYLGLGPAAHSFLNGNRFQNSADLEVYFGALGQGQLPTVADRSGRKERITEAIMLGLRTSAGVDRVRFRRRFGSDPIKLLNRDQFKILTDSGHLLKTATHLRLADDAMLLADEITRRLV